MKSIVNDARMQNRVIGLISNSSCPVTVGFVAFNLRVHYLTAKTLLLTLMAEGRIEGERTTRSWIFRKKRDVGSSYAERTPKCPNGQEDANTPYRSENGEAKSSERAIEDEAITRRGAGEGFQTPATERHPSSL